MDLCLFLLCVGFMTSGTTALLDKDGKCPMVSEMSCPSVRLAGYGNDVVQLVPKFLPTDHPIATHPEIASRDTNLICNVPDCLSNPCLNGGTCVETFGGFRCHCPCYDGELCEELSSTCLDCEDIYNRGQNSSGVYLIKISKMVQPFKAFCDMENDGGGWLVFQRRQDGSVSFYRDWIDFKTGFGNLSGEFWLGNEAIHLITNQKPYELRIDMTQTNDTHHVSYSVFRVADEADSYKLTIGGYSGNIGNAMKNQNKMRFSTIDRDNDNWQHSCARSYGGWWHNSCFLVNLNGPYKKGNQNFRKITWKRGPNWLQMKTTSMKLRPVYKTRTVLP